MLSPGGNLGNGWGYAPSNGPGYGIDISIDQSGTTQFTAYAGSVADDFPIPTGRSCNKLYVVFDGMRYFSTTYVQDTATGPNVSLPDNPRNPVKLRFGILHDNATTHDRPASMPAIIWLDVSAPVGNWSNITNFANGAFLGTRIGLLDWFELDLSTLNNGQGLGTGRYWLVMSAYTYANGVYTHLDTSLAKYFFYNFYTIGYTTALAGLPMYGAPLMRPDNNFRTFYTDDGVNGTLIPSWDKWTKSRCPPIDPNCGVSMTIIGSCTSDGTETNVYRDPLPPPICVQSAAYYRDTSAWTCSSHNTSSGITTLAAPTTTITTATTTGPLVPPMTTTDVQHVPTPTSNSQGAIVSNRLALVSVFTVVNIITMLVGFTD